MPVAGHLCSLQPRRQDVTPLHCNELSHKTEAQGQFPPVPPPSTLDQLPPSIKTVKNTSEGPGPAGFVAAGVTGFSFRCSASAFSF